MDYPAWYVPFLTAPMLIPLVAVPHVIVAQLAVGGGFLLADLVAQARRAGNTSLLDYLKGLTRIFVLITIVFGAVTGVGIWWTIGLASPETTSALIRIFAFGWAAEWAVFVLELSSAFVFYYLWDRLPAREHVAVGWIYALSAWMSLVLITGITAFMLTSGGWTPERGFFHAFFNPSFVPQVFLRTGGSIAMAALGIVLHLTFQPDDTPWKNAVIRRISRWALLGVILMALGGIGYALVMPEHATLNLIRAPMLLIMLVFNFLITLLVIGALVWGYAVGSRWITPPSAALLLLAGMIAITTGEFVREGSRKPYRIDGFILAPGARVTEVDEIKRDGLIRRAPWLRYYVVEKLRPDGAEAQGARLGEAIFRYHCASCHALWGYNGMVPLILPWTPELIRDAINHLHRANPAMPPWMGSESERQALAAYLVSLKERTKLP